MNPSSILSTSSTAVPLPELVCTKSFMEIIYLTPYFTVLVLVDFIKVYDEVSNEEWFRSSCPPS